MIQRFTSAGTSINSKRVPMLFKRFCFKGKSVLDYGCGKYPEIIKEFVESQPGKYFGYDPFNLGNEIPKDQKFDVVTISNVLNVIKEDEVIAEIIKEVTEIAGTVIVSIYEGDGSGKGRETKSDCYQRNQKKEWYYHFIGRMGYNVKIEKGCILVER